MALSSRPFRRLTGRCASACLAVGLVLAAAAPAPAQTSMTVAGGLDGWVRPGYPTPVAITFSNPGGAARVWAGLHLTPPSVPNTYTERVPRYRLAETTLPSGARQRYFLYPAIPSWVSATPEVSLWEDGRETNRAAVTLSVLDPGNTLLVAVGRPLNFLAEMTLPAVPAAAQAGGMTGGGPPSPPRLRVAAVPPSGLPDLAAGYAAANLLYLGDVPGDDLTPQQQEAIADWVAQGGTLVLPGGAAWQRLRHPFYARLLPGTLTASQVLSAAPGVGRAAGVASPSGAYLAARLAPAPGASAEAVEEGVPLVVRGRYGLGNVLFLAFDPTAPPFRDWSGVTGFWKWLLTAGELPLSFADAVIEGDQEENGFAYRYGQRRGPAATAPSPAHLPPLQLRAATEAVPQVDLPGFWWIALFIVGYLLVLVPLNYVFLRRRGKREAAWITTPAIVLLFSMGAYGIGYALRGGQVVLVRAGILEATAGLGRARAVTYAGLFAPRRGDYQVSAAAAGPLLDPLPPDENEAPRGQSPVLIQGEGVRLEDFRVEMWEMRPLRADGMVNLGQGFTLEGGGAAPAIRNGSPFDLEGCSLVRGDRAQLLGDVRRGGSVELRWPGPAPPAGPGPLTSALPLGLLSSLPGAGAERRLKTAILEPFTHNHNAMATPAVPACPYPLLVGWIRQPVVDLRVDGQPARGPAATLVLIHLRGLEARK